MGREARLKQQQQQQRQQQQILALFGQELESP